ncbi:MAG: single-stranded-DNA-specific exonuclease RecJ [Candidatus Omnitrophica bacterium]|nr:single-stranded-DNA-specific exonuclease RecJ [Candidatus Omnitrophota bacterium]MDD5430177.1 single-stranded-DNA-specific exonuclease RecJ [Candidatus Omnitrophota bacterium]
MKRRIWKIKKQQPQAFSLAQKYNISVFLAQVLLNRNVQEENLLFFLDSSGQNFHSPDALPDIRKASCRIKRAVSGGEKVVVFGDYDVDGITSLAIFNEFAADYPGIFSFHIPNRIEQGYGLNQEFIEKSAKDKVSLIVAFDCGTNAVEEISLANSLGIDVIVIDHHHIGESNISPLAFVNSKREDSSYPFLDLSSGALSFKLLQVLTGSPCRQALDLVALSIVCDVVPLQGENRSLLNEGLKVIKTSSRPAIKALCKAGKIKQENIDIFHIGYILGPRINASGRMADARDSLDLFLTQEQSQADSIAFRLNDYNLRRRAIEAQILKEAQAGIDSGVYDDYIIVAHGQDWHPGVLGIVASRLADKYCRPAFVISFNKGEGKGSGRSVHSVHLMEVLRECSDCLLAYGGHSKAAGINISEDNLEDFKNRVNSFLKSKMKLEDFIPLLEIDAVLKFEDINMDFVESIERLKPYGEGNPRPVFLSRNIFKRSEPKKVYSYFSLWLSDGVKTFEGLIYDKDVLEVLACADSFDIAFSLENNPYHNTSRLIIKDCRFSGGE